MTIEHNTITGSDLHDPKGKDGVLALDASDATAYRIETAAGNIVFEVDTAASPNEYLFGNATDNPYMALVGTGRLGVGIAAPQTNLHVQESNTDTTPAVEIEQLSTGDAAIQLSIAGDSYAIGIDNSDSDLFKISYAATAGAAALGTNDLFEMDSSGFVGLGGYDVTSADANILNVAYSVGNVAFYGEVSSTDTTPFGDTAGLELRNTDTTDNNYVWIAFTDSDSAHEVVGAIAGRITSQSDDTGQLLFASEFG